MQDAPIESADDDSINREKKESFQQEAQAELRMERARKEMKEPVSRVQEEIIKQKFEEARIMKKEALIKRERAYQKEEKSEETNEVAEDNDASKITYEGREETPDSYYKAVTENAIQDLERAVQTERTMVTRLENAEDKDEAISRKVDLQNAKLSKENAQKALEKAEEKQEEVK
jgi:hypothetical protein